MSTNNNDQRNTRSQSESAKNRLMLANSSKQEPLNLQDQLNSINTRLNQPHPEIETIKTQIDVLSEQMTQLMSLIKNTNQPIREPQRSGSSSPIDPSIEPTKVAEPVKPSAIVQTLQQVQLQHVSIMVPPKFDGNTSDAIMWLIDYKEIVTINKWTEDDSLNYVRQSLVSAAKAWYRSIWFETKPETWQVFENEFKQAFLRDDSSDSLRARLRRLKQTREMDPMTYYFKTMELCAMVDRNMSERDRIDHVIDNLLPDVRSAIRMRDPSSIIELQRAIKLWMADHPHDSSNQFNKSKKPNDDRRSQDKSKLQHPKEEHWCANCGKKGHFPRECPQPYNHDAVVKRREEWRKNPPFKNRNIESNFRGKAQALSTDEANRLEFSEETVEFGLDKCSEPDRDSIGVINYQLISNSVTGVEPRKRPSSITCKINGQQVNAILDTGATLSVVPLSLVKETKTPIFKWRGKSLGLANGGTQTPVGWCEANVDYDNRTYSIHAVVLQHAPDILLGDDYITKSKMIISYADKIIAYADNYSLVERVKHPQRSNRATQTAILPVPELKVPKEDEKPSLYYIEYLEDNPQISRITESNIDVPETTVDRDVKSESNLLIPPKSRARITAKTTGPESTCPLWMESHAQGALFVIPGISRRTRHVLDVINANEDPIQVYKNDVIARAVPIDSYIEQDHQQKAELTAQQETQLKNLLDQYEGLFVTQNENIGIVPFIKHVIDTGDAEPIRSKAYRISFKEQQVIRKLVDEMLEAGVIRPSRSHWASPVVLVKKKGTSDLRFCVDYRKLNKVTKVDPYPIPNMEAVLETLSGNHWFSKLDIKAMYWQVLMDEASKPKTAFVVHCGHYEFNVMPFGLVAAPMTAMRVMNEVVKGMESNAFVFYDDILVYTSNFESHLEALKLLFEKLKKANITLNKNKCELLMKSVTYLGHLVTPEGILPDPNKVKAIRAFRAPQNITQARSFIGMCNFFRRFIRGFSSIAKPIHDTIKINQRFVWTDEAQLAMEQLKLKLMSPPVLVHYDQASEPTIRCDASGYGLGAVLMQRSDDPKKNGVVSYTSRTLSKSERNYATTHKECLAMVHAVKQWRYYLYGKQFIVITDHHALCWLMKTKDHNGQLARWSLILQEFTFTIQYESGKLHDDADCLSRNPMPTEDGADEESEVPTWPICAIRGRDKVKRLLAKNDVAVPTFDVAKEQQGDENLKEIIRILEDPEAPRREKRKLKHFMLKDHQLYRRSKKNKSTYLLVIPESMNRYVLEQAHDTPTAGHFGVKRTLETLRSRFYWKTLDQDVKHYVRTCDKCQKRKADNRPKEGFMVPMPIPTQPFEIVGADLLGPLPMSTSKKNHIMVMTDYLTKFVIASPMRKTTTERIAEHLKRLLFFKFGVPKTIVTDNGANLTSYEMRQLFDLLKITHKTTSPYRPQTNGQIERYNRVIGSQLAIFASEKPQDWDKYLDALVFAYNTSIHASHLQTPYYLVHGREARKFIDLVAENPKQYIASEHCDLTDQEIITEARRFAKGLIEASQLKSKHRYDLTRVTSTYKVGDLVLKKKQLNQMKESRKMSFPYYGPFKVVRRLNDVNIQIASVEDPGEQHIVHVSQVKPYHPRIDAAQDDIHQSDTDSEPILDADDFELSRDNFRIPEFWYNRPIAASDDAHLEGANSPTKSTSEQ
uniref:RNA-directed DNA polymerase n=2 Tax=Aceria tosichella TaxID=561515 RepID=A0A6G1SP10_9ACAR